MEPGASRAEGALCTHTLIRWSRATPSPPQDRAPSLQISLGQGRKFLSWLEASSPHQGCGKQSFMNKKQGLTTLKETEQRETPDQRGLAEFQGQIQRQMLVLLQNKKRKIPQLYRKSCAHFPSFPGSFGSVSAERTKHFLFPSGSREPSLPLLLNALSFSPSACRASLKQLCLVQNVEVGRLNCS